MIKLLVSIVNYNSYADTLDVVESILKEVDTQGYIVNFFIVDNSSDKSQQDFFVNAFTKLAKASLVNDLDSLGVNSNYVFDSDNYGFGAANNIVMDYVTTSKYYDVIWLLNNDLELDENCLKSLRPYMGDDKYPVLGSTVIEGNTIISGTDNMDSFKGYGYPNPQKTVDNIFVVDAAIGTSMFLKRVFFNGLRFDENLFMYVEENDLCFRLKKIGVNSYIVKNSKVYHESGKTFGDRQALRWYYKVRNLLYFKKKNNANNSLLIAFLLLLTFKNYRFNRAYLKAYFFGVYDYSENNLGQTFREFT